MLLVIVGHLPPLEFQPIHEIIYWFHMPLFFFLSGFLLKAPTSLGSAVVRRTRQLAIPYFCYLVILETPKYISLINDSAHRLLRLQDLLLDFVWGGSRLKGPTVIFWFVPVLLFACIIGYFLLDSKRTTKMYVGLAAAIVVSVLGAPYVRNVPLPFDIGAVPYALAFLLFGVAYRSLQDKSRTWMAYAGACLFALSIALNLSGRLQYLLDMKYCKFDMPALSFIVGLAGILTTTLVSKAAARSVVLNKALGHVGRKSLTVMYLHGPIIFLLYFKVKALGPTTDTLQLLEHVLVLSLAGLLFPLAADYIFERFALTRKLFLTS